jgi:hypothetical protein
MTIIYFLILHFFCCQIVDLKYRRDLKKYTKYLLPIQRMAVKNDRSIRDQTRLAAPARSAWASVRRQSLSLPIL